MSLSSSLLVIAGWGSQRKVPSCLLQQPCTCSPEHKVPKRTWGDESLSAETSRVPDCSVHVRSQWDGVLPPDHRLQRRGTWIVRCPVWITIKNNQLAYELVLYHFICIIFIISASLSSRVSSFTSNPVNIWIPSNAAAVIRQHLRECVTSELIYSGASELVQLCNINLLSPQWKLHPVAAGGDRNREFPH